MAVLIDVGQEAVNRGFVEAVCEGILGALYGNDSSAEDDEQQNGEEPKLRRNLPLGSKVGFLTFDKEVHFYNTSVRVSSSSARQP
jgi:protein transport protein SEC24